ISATGAENPWTTTGAVIACVSFDKTLTGPSTSTVDGSAVTVPTTNPSAGSPSTVGTTGTTLLPDSSNAIETVDGFTCTTSTPKGALTSSPPRRKSRWPARARRRSRTATSSPAAMRFSAPEDTRTRPPATGGCSPTTSTGG